MRHLPELRLGNAGRPCARQYRQTPSLGVVPVHVFDGDFKVAWFKDPDGNIIALM
jgi:hypothetical protein